MPSPSKQQGITQYLPLIPSAGSTATICVLQRDDSKMFGILYAVLSRTLYIYYSHCY